ncbi:hypothetical protein P692DRAFT_20804878 [Suillus brevipes Sb2]|nr:hypothetical protein P692DRAFT_20804878 [Suillus brevipes Sb2]
MSRWCMITAWRRVHVCVAAATGPSPAVMPCTCEGIEAFVAFRRGPGRGPLLFLYHRAKVLCPAPSTHTPPRIIARRPDADFTDVRLERALRTAEDTFGFDNIRNRLFESIPRKKSSLVLLIRLYEHRCAPATRCSLSCL